MSIWAWIIVVGLFGLTFWEVYALRDALAVVAYKRRAATAELEARVEELERRLESRRAGQS